MPTVNAFDLQLYHESLGDPQAPTLLLIHGAGATGRRDWAPVLDRLAGRFHVLLPDCRGHGRTLDPRNEYRFATLAADLAQFLRAVDCAPAFVAGHSNGGNVALVMAVEHPEVVRRAVLMAANAHVSPDLRRYAHGHWPERISPEWARELAALHDPGRHPGYWRDLMRRTAAEIARAPNYTPDDLAAVRCPALVVQGERDPVNAPWRHAEFMAKHLGNARLWLAEGAGHNVHAERPEEWVERVTRFLLEEPATEARFA